MEEALEFLECDESDHGSSGVQLEPQCHVQRDESTPLMIKYDMGWQKRSSGRLYNSQSGVGCAIGQETGKVLDYGVCCKSCSKCTYWKSKGTEPPVHFCSKNFAGSSKAMALHVAVQIVQRIESNENLKVANLVMDEDCTTLSRVKSVINHDINKYSDIMHVKKRVLGDLYKLQKKSTKF